MDREAVKGGTTITLPDQIRAYFYAQPKYRFLLVLAIAAAVIANTVSFPKLADEVAGYCVMVITLLLVVAALLVAANVIAVIVWNARLSEAQRVVTYEFNSSEITIGDQTGVRITIPWTIVRRAKEVRSAFLLYLRPLGVRYFPKRAFEAQDTAVVRELIAKKLAAGTS